ncbi:MAG: hypothetical protein AVDCRST_MAG13-637 [uncultured Solirubrobacteraceae bacterium]|uniref:Uncharacterized protein n=1 Tax=uncultured Solirubrobacteraceae bacterium TaxID=1162706 RepID=A0A6J4RQ40_9ACTN|nr:MAG: hypothetical protein AVDCRST_MAG13-637 [uncultured Solirubrobacteraceae bacterium]
MPAVAEQAAQAGRAAVVLELDGGARPVGRLVRRAREEVALVDPGARVVDARAGGRRPLAQVVGGVRARAVRVAPHDVRRRDAQPPHDLADAAQPAPAQRRAGEVAADRAEPREVEDADGGHVPRAEGERAKGTAPAVRAAGERDPGAGGRAGARGDHAVGVGALGDRVDPRVERREDRLVVVGRRAVVGERRREPRHHPGGQPLEGRDGRVDVGVVAVDRVDVVAQPQARIGDRHPGGCGVLGERGGQAPGVGGLDALLEAQEPGGLGLQPPVDPARDEAVVVVARHEHELAAGAERLADLGEERRRELRDAALRAVAQLDRVAEDHEPVGLADRRHQRLAQVGAAQQVRAVRGADVQVGDHERAHGRLRLTRLGRHGAAGTPRRPAGRRLLASARRPLRHDGPRRPRRRRGQGGAPGRRRRHPRLGPALARRREHVLPGSQPQQALARPRPHRPRGPGAGARARGTRRRESRDREPDRRREANRQSSNAPQAGRRPRRKPLRTARR